MCPLDVPQRTANVGPRGREVNLSPPYVLRACLVGQATAWPLMADPGPLGLRIHHYVISNLIPLGPRRPRPSSWKGVFPLIEYDGSAGGVAPTGPVVIPGCVHSVFVLWATLGGPTCTMYVQAEPRHHPNSSTFLGSAPDGKTGQTAFDPMLLSASDIVVLDGATLMLQPVATGTIGNPCVQPYISTPS